MPQRRRLWERELTELVLTVFAAVVLVFAGSASTKLRSRASYEAYRSDLARTKLARPPALRAVAAILVVGEALTAIGAATAFALVVAGPALAVDVAVGVLGTAIALTSILAGGIVMILHRGTSAPCACFGSSSQRPLGIPHLARNLVLLSLLAAAALCLAYSHGRPSAGAAALTVFTGLIVGLLLIRFDDIVELFAPLPTGSVR
jgi:hypothetical protein